MKVEPRTITTCRVCDSAGLDEVLSLGNQFVSNFLDSPDQVEVKVPLELVFCKNCKLLQLRHTTPAEVLYRWYWYRSGISPTMRAALADITRKAVSLVDLQSGDVVVDIGANDGTLLRTYPESLALTRVGFEPAKNLIESQDKECIIINDFFNYRAFQERFADRKAKIITAIAMFYDLDNPNNFVADVASCLHENGLFIIQMNYLPAMLELNAFDNIGHEHLEYYSMKSLKYLLGMHKLEIFDAELNDVNGGSFRVYVKHKDAKLGAVKGSEQRIRDLDEREERMRLDDKNTYIAFANRIDRIRNQARDFLEREARNGKTIYIRGASTRGNTTLQYFGLDHNLIRKAADRNKDKWGKFIPGTGIPIIPVEQAFEEKPDYFLVLPWHFLDELVEEAREYLSSGGKFVVALPGFRVLDLG
jgi:NDP-4-keto-2,6-dideoxyhexose 3-C-methyltransferase